MPPDAGARPYAQPVFVGGAAAVGPIGKFYLFAVAAQQQMYWLVFVAAVNSTISLYYYLGVVRRMYMEKSTETFRSR